MPLYHIRDDTRPAWVVADSMQLAITKYKDALWSDLPEDDKRLWQDADAIAEPDGIEIVCDDGDLIIENEWFDGNAQGDPDGS